MNTLSLQQQFLSFTNQYCDDAALGETIFLDLVSRYNEPHRHYHNLTHIITLLNDAGTYFKSAIPGELFFAIWFHDAIYDSTSSKNEVRSAELAAEALTKLGCSDKVISSCAELIRKTADHLSADISDVVTQFFMDADLKILGSSEAEYQQYVETVRKEYFSIPALLFNIGRRKFLRKALRSKRIFRTQEYFDKYEQTARKNLENELTQLS